MNDADRASGPETGGREPLHLDADWHQRAKDGQGVAGDTVAIRRIPEEGRLVAVLADGLGSGVKAAVLASLTATIALRHTAEGRDLRRTAELIARTLPVCSVRQIGYSTLTILDVCDDGHARIVNQGNPPTMLVRGNTPSTYHVELIDINPDRRLRAAELILGENDRLVAVSDGVTQAGMGRAALPFGWGVDGLRACVGEALDDDRALAARQLASVVVDAALAQDDGRACDDTTCLVVHLRRPRRLLVVTGAPYDAQCDAEIAALVADAPGRIAICGGTTAQIVSRELHRPISLDHGPLDPCIPPTATMRGVELVAEGMITLAATARLLAAPGDPELTPVNGATRLAALLLDSDVIDFVVGTRINEAHQDPTLPVELGIRRNLVRGLASTLTTRWARRATVRFV